MMKPLLTVKDVAGILRVSVSHVYKLVERGDLPAIRFECPKSEGSKRGKATTRVREADLGAYIEKNTNGAAADLRAQGGTK